MRTLPLIMSASLAIGVCMAEDAPLRVRNAVHGVIFKGFAGGDGCIGQKALVPNPGAEMENEEYFRLFFSDKGEYRKYVSIVAGSELSEKVGKEYRAGAVVSIQKDELRKALEAAGIIKGLNYGF